MKSFNKIISILCDTFPLQMAMDRISLETVKFARVKTPVVQEKDAVQPTTIIVKEKFFPFDRKLEELLGDSRSHLAKNNAENFEKKHTSPTHFISFL